MSNNTESAAAPDLGQRLAELRARLDKMDSSLAPRLALQQRLLRIVDTERETTNALNKVVAKRFVAERDFGRELQPYTLSHAEAGARRGKAKEALRPTFEEVAAYYELKVGVAQRMITFARLSDTEVEAIREKVSSAHDSPYSVTKIYRELTREGRKEARKKQDQPKAGNGGQEKGAEQGDEEPPTVGLDQVRASFTAAVQGMETMAPKRRAETMRQIRELREEAIGAVAKADLGAYLTEQVQGLGQRADTCYLRWNEIPDAAKRELPARIKEAQGKLAKLAELCAEKKLISKIERRNVA